MTENLMEIGRSISITILTAILVASSTGCSNREGREADLVLTGGNVYTLNWPRPDDSGKTSEHAPYSIAGWSADAEAIAIRDGNIIAIGSDEEIQSLIGSKTRVIDVEGSTILPGLVDSHTHVPELGASLRRVNLVGIETEVEAVELIAARAQTVPEGEWIVGQGWDEGAWADHYPDMKLISQRVPDHPVFMRSLHGFGGWGNQLAFTRANITRETPDPSGGEIRRFSNGEVSGLLLNRAVKLLDDAIPKPSSAELKRQIVAGLEQMARDGYVTVHDAGLDTRLMRALTELEEEGRLPIRVYAMLSARDADLSRQWIEKGPDSDADSMLVTRSVKAYYDGALGSRGARMLADYSDKAGHRGVSGSEYGFDQELVTRLMAKGFQVGVHAIGDAGNRETLDFFQQVFELHPQSQVNRHRIEHAQVIHPDDLPRLSRMKIIASMEPPHAVEDKTWAEERIGSERIKGAYAWQSLRQSGAIVIFNSDNPGSDHSIFYGLHSAITRQDKSQQPEGGWYPGQAFTIEQSIRAYTTLAAFAAFRELETGSIEIGKWADLTVMDLDPFALAKSDPHKILGGRIEMTIVAGKVVYNMHD